MKQHLGRLGFLAFYAAALVVSGWFLATKLGRVAAEKALVRLAALDSIRSELTQSKKARIDAVLKNLDLSAKAQGL